MTLLVALLLMLAVAAAWMAFWYRTLFSPRYWRDEALLHTYPSHPHAFELIVDQNVRLEGLAYEPEGQAAATVLYFGGREQDSVGLVPRLAALVPEVRWVAFNYRGYGNSVGRPSEAKLLADALAVADFVTGRYGPISVMGFSLGASVAAYTASRRSVEGLFMVAAFDSVPALARARYPFVIPFLVRYRFDTAAHVRAVTAPTYLFTAAGDETVPLANARHLKSCIRNLAFYREFEGFGHDDLLLSEDVVNIVRKAVAT